jgi:putative DNA modification/repair radical SAM protein
MLSQAERNQIIDLINREVVPAIGCTEPIAVALCTARAAETLGGEPEKITVRLSANILKNAMGVGIPGTGMIGLPIAVALGALVGRSEYQLEVLRDVTPEAVERGRRMIDGRRIAICLKEDVDEKLYIEAEAEAAGHRAVAVIAGGHTSFVFVSRDGETLLDRRTPAAGGGEEEDVPLTLARVWDFAMTSPLDELRFILETSRLNKAAAERSFAGEFGHCVGRTLCCDRERKVMGDSIFTRILSYTSAACDARMAGAMIPVMSNSGSGNQGIAATLPVVVYAEETHASEEQMIRALRILRETYRFNGYIHAKAIPGAAPELVRELGLLADRLSVNIELPSQEGLQTLAPDKNKQAILRPMALIRDRTAQSKAELVQYKHAQVFAPAGQSTQLIVGATRDTDRHILHLTESLYQKYRLKRVFYSAYVPVVENALLPSLDTKPPLLREHRLYQADWLLRFYGFKAQELLDEAHPDFNPLLDPKCHWALCHLEQFPVEIRKADLETLLRVPGIGPVSARRIVSARRQTPLRLEDLPKLGVVLKRAQFFVTCGGRMRPGLHFSAATLSRQLEAMERGQLPPQECRQLSLFDAG